MLVQDMRLRDRLYCGRGAFVCENIAKQNLKSSRGASAASVPITECTYRQVAEHLLANGFRREIQQLADVQKRKRPGRVIYSDPAISIEIEFPLDAGRRAMEPAQILYGLFEDFGCQFSLARPGCVIVGFHVVFRCHLFLKLSKI